MKKELIIIKNCKQVSLINLSVLTADSEIKSDEDNLSSAQGLLRVLKLMNFEQKPHPKSKICLFKENVNSSTSNDKRQEKK